MNDRMRAQGYQSAITAEKIAAGQRSAEEVVAGWLKSPGHCRNILLPELREIGVGVVVKPSSERGRTPLGGMALRPWGLYGAG